MYPNHEVTDEADETEGESSERRSRWLEPILAALLFSLSVVVQFEPLPWAWALSFVICVSAALAATYPRGAALVTIAALLGFLFLPGLSVSIAGLGLFVNVFALARNRIPESVPLIASLVGAGCLTMVIHSSQGIEDAVTSGALLLVFLALSVGSGYLWSGSERRLQHAAEEADRQLSELRTQLARDLHDTVAQTLSNAAMRAHMAGLDDTLSCNQRKQLNLIASDCSTAAQDLRQLLGTLRDLDRNPPSTTGGLADVDTVTRTVKEQAERLEQENFKVDYTLRLDEPVGATRAEALSRLTVEAVNNMIKHGKPEGRCRLMLESDEHRILAVYANESPHRPVRRNRLGLVGMQERVLMLEGSLDVMYKDGWWVLEVVLPQSFYAATQLETPPGQEHTQIGRD